MHAVARGRSFCVSRGQSHYAGRSSIKYRAGCIVISGDHLRDIGPPESAVTKEMLFVDPDKGREIVLYTSVITEDFGFYGQ